MTENQNAINEGPEVNSEIEGVLEEVAQINPAAAEKLERFIAVRQVRYQGPMPSPDMLHEYMQIQPDLPERMMCMAERAQESKIIQHEKLLALKEQELILNTTALNNEDRAHRREIASQNFSLALAFVALLVCILGSFYLAIEGHKELALILGGSTVVAVVGSFLSSRFKK